VADHQSPYFWEDGVSDCCDYGEENEEEEIQEEKY
jgi:hypothetical protein